MIKKNHFSYDPVINVKYLCKCNIHGVQVSEHNVYFSTLKSNLFLMFRYGDMMSRPGSMMMGGGIGGYMPMSRLHFKHIFAARNISFL